MSIEWLLFVILVVMSFINQGVQMYIHFNAYPLLGYVGKAEFAEYIKQYEKRLLTPLLLPGGITILVSIALIFIRPEIVPIVGVIILLVLNLSVAGVTIMLATPVYSRIVAAGEAKGADMAKLMQINLIRLGITTLASGVLAVLIYLIVANIA